MFYRESGQFKASYKADSAKFPIFQDKLFIWFYVFIGFLVIPYFGSEFFLGAIMIPFLVFTLASIGLNILRDIQGKSHSGQVPLWG